MYQFTVSSGALGFLLYTCNLYFLQGRSNRHSNNTGVTSHCNPKLSVHFSEPRLPSPPLCSFRIMVNLATMPDGEPQISRRANWWRASLVEVDLLRRKYGAGEIFQGLRAPATALTESNFQHSFGTSQLFVTPIPRDLIPSSDWKLGKRMVYICACKQNNHTHKVK